MMAMTLNFALALLNLCSIGWREVRMGAVEHGVDVKDTVLGEDWEEICSGFGPAEL